MGAAAALIPATARGEATRKRLLAAAEKEFGEQGFHGASIASITQRARVAQGTFYLYFRSKEELFSTLVRETGAALRREMRKAVEAAPDRAAAERAGLNSFLDFALAHPGLYRLVQEAQFVDEPAFREYYERVAEGYGALLDEAAGRGELTPGEGRERAWAIMGIGHFLGLRHCLWRGARPPKKALDQAVEFIAHGMARNR